MHAAWIVFAISALGAGPDNINFGYKPRANGGYIYELQLQPAVLDQLETKKELALSSTLPEWMHVCQFRISMGQEKLPQERNPLAEDENFVRSLRDLRPEGGVDDSQIGYTPTTDGYSVKLQLTSKDVAALRSGRAVFREIPDWLQAHDFRLFVGGGELTQQAAGANNRSDAWSSESTNDRLGDRLGDRVDSLPLRRNSQSRLDDDRLGNSRTSMMDDEDRSFDDSLRPTDTTRRANNISNRRDTMSPIDDRDRAAQRKRLDLETGLLVDQGHDSPSSFNLPNLLNNITPSQKEVHYVQVPPQQPAQGGNNQAKPDNNNDPSGATLLAFLAISLCGNGYLGLLISQQRNRYWEVVERVRRMSDRDIERGDRRDYVESVPRPRYSRRAAEEAAAAKDE